LDYKAFRGLERKNGSGYGFYGNFCYGLGLWDWGYLGNLKKILGRFFGRERENNSFPSLLPKLGLA